LALCRPLQIESVLRVGVILPCPLGLLLSSQRFFNFLPFLSLGELLDVPPVSAACPFFATTTSPESACLLPLRCARPSMNCPLPSNARLPLSEGVLECFFHVVFTLFFPFIFSFSCVESLPLRDAERVPSLFEIAFFCESSLPTLVLVRRTFLLIRLTLPSQVSHLFFYDFPDATFPLKSSPAE